MSNNNWFVKYLQELNWVKGIDWNEPCCLCEATTTVTISTCLLPLTSLYQIKLASIKTNQITVFEIKKGKYKIFESELAWSSELVPNFMEVMRSVVVNDYVMYLQFKFGATLLFFYNHTFVSAWKSSMCIAFVKRMIYL